MTLAPLILLGTVPLTMTPPREIDPLLDDLSQRAVRFFWEQSHPETGMTLDRANNTRDEPRIEYVASIAAVGFALSSYAIGAERGWLDREEALARTKLTFRSLEELPIRNNGWFVHFYDWKTGERVWQSETSSIDTSILIGGMLVADSYWRDPEIKERTARILAEIDWEWMLTDGGAKPNSLTFSMGWKPESGFIEARWQEYNELIMLPIQALGVWAEGSEGMWTAWKREPLHEDGGYEFLTGGPLFLHQMSHVYIDLAGKRDGLGWDYWKQAHQAFLANRQYCIDNPKGFKGYGPDTWGLSAADGPRGYNAYGAPGWISDDGTMAPSSAVACVDVIPELAIAAAHGFKREFPDTLGRYGFTISFNPTEGWQSPDVIGIDLGQMLLAIENYRDGLPHFLSMSHPVVRRGIQRAGIVTTHEGPLEGRALKK